jgi:hypothetical protein
LLRAGLSKSACPVAALAMSNRRFPPPWSVEEQDPCFGVKYESGQQLAYVYYAALSGRYGRVRLSNFAQTPSSDSETLALPPSQQKERPMTTAIEYRLMADECFQWGAPPKHPSEAAITKARKVLVDAIAN